MRSVLSCRYSQPRHRKRFRVFGISLCIRELLVQTLPPVVVLLKHLNLVPMQTSASCILLIFYKRNPGNNPEYSDFLYLNGNRRCRLFHPSQGATGQESPSTAHTPGRSSSLRSSWRTRTNLWTSRSQNMKQLSPGWRCHTGRCDHGSCMPPHCQCCKNPACRRCACLLYCWCEIVACGTGLQGSQ